MNPLHQLHALPILLGTATLPLSAAASTGNAQFESPVRMKAGGQPISITDPGYATPAWVDVTGDGREDLVVGQFDHGRIQIFERTENGTLTKGRWLMANDAIAAVPDVW